VTARHPHPVHPPRRQAPQRRHLRAAIVATLALVLGTAFVFARQSLFQSGFRVRAVVASASQLRTGSEVRIGGIKVGVVDGISAGPRNTSTIEMRIDDQGLPIHDDAALTVRPRLLLEGNAYVDLNPGTPGAAPLHADAVIPLSHTAVSVQLDQVLDVFDSPTRHALQASVAGLAGGLGRGTGEPPTSPSGHDALRAAVRALDGSLIDITRTAHAIRGTRSGDLGRAIASSGDVATQLAREALADSVTGFRRVMGDLAAEDHPLAQTVSGFDALLRAAPPSLTKIDSALQPLTQFAGALRPAMHTAPVTLRKASALLGQVGGLTRPAELPRLLEELAPVTSALPSLESRLRTMFGYTNQVTGCIATHVVPVLDTKIQDGANTTGDPAWLDLLHGITGFTSSSTSLDGNAGTDRAGLAFGAAALQGVIPGIGTVAGQLSPQIEGVRPVWLGYGVEPRYRPDQPCAHQPLPNLNAESGPPPSWDLHSVTPGSGR
jgi:ABC-type transporter Mla subunit MlaD